MMMIIRYATQCSYMGYTYILSTVFSHNVVYENTTFQSKPINYRLCSERANFRQGV